MMELPQKKMALVNEYFEVFDEFLLYVTFKVENEEFGVEALHLQEVGHYAEPLRLPRTPSYIQGLINFRGQMIPLLNLRKLFGGKSDTDSGQNSLLVVETGGITFGMMADEIIDTVNLPQSGIHSTEDFNNRISGHPFQKAVFQGKENQIHLLDLDKIATLKPNHGSAEESTGTFRESVRNTG